MRSTWQKWEKHYERLGLDPKLICTDGIPYEKGYLAARRRVAFVLKETNDFSGDLWCLLKDGPKFQMWHTLARWSAGILNGFPPFEEIDRYDVMKESLLSVAVVNLKKATGGASADMSIINAYAHQDRELLAEQFDDVRPHLIVACGTMDPLVWLLDLRVDVRQPLNVPVRDDSREAWVLRWRHPGRVNNRKSYDELKDLVSRIPGGI